jgi:DNA-binding LacI/PurR family transcriptional regulator
MRTRFVPVSFRSWPLPLASVSLPMKVTITDIASLVNVSPTTVSRALKNDSRITEQVRQKVKHAAEKLGYRPNLMARALVSSRTHAIGYIVDNLSWSFFSELAESIQTAAESCHYSSYIHSSLKRPENERQGIESLLSRGVEGLLISPTEAKENLEIIRDLGLKKFPLVLLSDIEELEVDKVVVDNYAGAYRVMEHLHGLGHRKILYIGPAENGNIRTQRLGAYHSYIERHDLTESKGLLFCEENDPMYGYRVVRRVMETKQRPTAIFAHNDTLALGVYRALYELGFRIPQDISVVGYDDLPSCEFVHPPLTSVGTPLGELATIAVGLLTGRIKQFNLDQVGSAPLQVRQKIALNPKLVIRRSTDKPPATS